MTSETVFPFNRETIDSRPIENENDLAEVIIELRKAVSYLVKENEDLKGHVEVMSEQMLAPQIRGMGIGEFAWDAAPMAGAPSITIGTPTSPWSGKTTSDMLLAREEAAKRMAEAMDAMVSPPMMISNPTEYTD